MAKCKKCGSVVDNREKFCGNCGNKMINEEVPNNSVPQRKSLPKGAVIAFVVVMTILSIVASILSETESSQISNDSIDLDITTKNITKKTKKKNEDEIVKEYVIQVVSDNFTRTVPSFINIEKNEETNKYKAILKYEYSDLDLYTCADNIKYLGKKVNGNDKLETIEFECSNSGTIIGYIDVVNLENVTEDNIRDNMKFYDTSHNETSTTMTALEQKVENDYKNSCQKYNYKDVLRNPENYEFKETYWFGKIVQVVDSYSYRVGVNCSRNRYADGGYICDDYIYMSYYGDTRLIENDIVKLYGFMNGTQTYTTVMGASVTIPSFWAKYVDIVG